MKLKMLPSNLYRVAAIALTGASAFEKGKESICLEFIPSVLFGTGKGVKRKNFFGAAQSLRKSVSFFSFSPQTICCNKKRVSIQRRDPIISFLCSIERKREKKLLIMDSTRANCYRTPGWNITESTKNHETAKILWNAILEGKEREKEGKRPNKEQKSPGFYDLNRVFLRVFILLPRSCNSNVTINPTLVCHQT